MNSFPAFLSLAHIFLILKAMAKKAKSIVTLSSPTCRNLLYAMLYFICPKTASGSIHRLPLCLIPSSESNLSRACRLYWFNRWLTSIDKVPSGLGKSGLYAEKRLCQCFFISYSRYHSRKISVQCIKNPKERLIKIKVSCRYYEKGSYKHNFTYVCYK